MVDFSQQKGNKPTLRLSVFFSVLILIFQVPALLAAPVPNSWDVRDYDPPFHRLYTIKVAQFPSEVLANGVARALNDSGWAPVRVETTAEGQFQVTLGEFAHPGRAWFVREELREQGLAEGEIITFLPTQRAAQPVGAQGPFLPLSISTATSAEGMLQRYRSEIMDISISLETDDRQRIEVMVDAWEKSDWRNEELGNGAAVFARKLWDARQSGDLAIYLTTQVASGEWAASSSAKINATSLMAELHYGYTRNWRAAWSATRQVMANPLRDPIDRLRDRLRQEALTVHLVGEGVLTTSVFPAMRSRLRRIYEETPQDQGDLLSRIALLYVQTFAWEGKWDRVEAIASDQLALFSDITGVAAMNRILLARSLERHSLYRRAISHLEQVSVPNSADHFRYGYEVFNPEQEAREWMDVLLEREMEHLRQQRQSRQTAHQVESPANDSEENLDQ